MVVTEIRICIGFYSGLSAGKTLFIAISGPLWVIVLFSWVRQILISLPLHFLIQ